MEERELQRKVSELSENGEWNCYFEFPFGIKTRTNHIDSPGYNIHKWERLKPIIKDLSIEDKTIIDIGCGDGFYAIQCAMMGSKYVLGSDIDLLRIKRANLAKNIYKLDNIEFKTVNLYEDNIKSFDILLGLGLLHRVPDIKLCLNRMSEISDILVLEFKTHDTEVNECLKLKQKSKSNNYNNLYYVPSINFIKSFLQDRGYSDFRVFLDKTSRLKYKRSIVLCKR
jgi:tRNA (mo5U34)-methyltransferase